MSNNNNNNNNNNEEYKNEGKLYLGDIVPNFEADTTNGKIKFHDFINDSWAILFSHPADFTPVCTTELAAVANLKDEWEKRGVRVIGLSCDTVESHHQWIKDIIEITKCSDIFYPIVADPSREIAMKFGMLEKEHLDEAGIPLTVRSIFVIGPDKKIKLTITYPAATGRNFNEILRVIDSLQIAVSHKVATPANWQPGDRTVVLPNISTDEAKKMFSNDVEEIRPWLRFTADPKNK